MIRVVKIKTGEEIIADIDNIDAIGSKSSIVQKVILGKPMSLHLVPSEQGIGIQLMPYAIYAKEQSIPIDGSEILFCVEPSTDIRNQYAQMTGMPVIPDDQIIVPTGGPKLSL